MGDERTDRIHIPAGSSEVLVGVPDGGSGPGVPPLVFSSPVRTLEG